MNNYLVLHRTERKGKLYVDKHNNKSKAAAAAVYRWNGLKVVDVILVSDIEAIAQNPEHRSYFNVMDLKGNGVI